MSLKQISLALPMLRFPMMVVDVNIVFMLHNLYLIRFLHQHNLDVLQKSPPRHWLLDTALTLASRALHVHQACR